jgi:uncharacterized membrane protein YgdD (TMEM256/DUF423 family)
MPRQAMSLAVLAALMGAVGVSLAALSMHADGGDYGRTASEFLVLHAAALVGIAAHVRTADWRNARALLIAGGALALGTIVFAGDLTSRAFTGGRLFPMAAPGGGTLIILSWIGLAIVFALGAMGEET